MESYGGLLAVLGIFFIFSVFVEGKKARRERTARRAAWNAPEAIAARSAKRVADAVVEQELRDIFDRLGIKHR